MNGNKKFSLCRKIQILTEVNSKKALLSFKTFSGLNVNNSNKIEILAVAYTSLLLNLIGNATLLDIESISYYPQNVSLYFVVRKVDLTEKTMGHLVGALQLQNAFFQRQFVSCGSRGLELMQFLQFFRAFDNNVRKCILAVTGIFVFATNVLSGSTFPFMSFDKLIYLAKVFSSKMTRFQPIRSDQILLEC